MRGKLEVVNLNVVMVVICIFAGFFSGVNTGPCITGDADCDGDPGRASAALIAADNTAVDQPLLDKGEFAVIVVDFGKSKC
jgi:hypothetical protein